MNDKDPSIKGYPNTYDGKTPSGVNFEHHDDHLDTFVSSRATFENVLHMQQLKKEGWRIKETGLIVNAGGNKQIYCTDTTDLANNELAETVLKALNSQPMDLPVHTWKPVYLNAKDADFGKPYAEIRITGGVIETRIL